MMSCPGQQVLTVDAVFLAITLTIGQEGVRPYWRGTACGPCGSGAYWSGGEKLAYAFREYHSRGHGCCLNRAQSSFGCGSVPAHELKVDCLWPTAGLQ